MSRNKHASSCSLYVGTKSEYFDKHSLTHAASRASAISPQVEFAQGFRAVPQSSLSLLILLSAFPFRLEPPSVCLARHVGGVFVPRRSGCSRGVASSPAVVIKT